MSNKTVVCTLSVLLVFLSFGSILPTVTVHANSTLVVPTNFPTIQSAVSAASPGDTIQVLAGTYVEQVTISKNLKLVGSGSSSTVVRAPSTLTTDSFGQTFIVEVNNGAVVTMTGFTVSGPGGATCGSLKAGISVVSGATLTLSSTTVTHIRDNPIQNCFPSDVAITVGLPPFIAGGTVGHATITNVVVTDYQARGIVVAGFGSTSTISNSLVIGVGSTKVAKQGGIIVAFGGVATITDNSISENICNIPSSCGADPINQFQATGITTVRAGAGTVISDNDVFSNDVGIYVVFNNGCCTTTDNTLANNRFFGLVIQDGNNTASDNSISGGNVGVAVVATAFNTVGTFQSDTISGTTVVSVQEISCCGFTATAILQS